MDDKLALAKEMGELKAELAGLHAEVKGLRERIDDALISQIRDHGKRIAALEAWRVWLVGWAAGAGLVSGVLVSLLRK